MKEFIKYLFNYRKDKKWRSNHLLDARWDEAKDTYTWSLYQVYGVEYQMVAMQTRSSDTEYECLCHAMKHIPFGGSKFKEFYNRYRPSDRRD